MSEMVELTPIPDVFCSGVGKIERMNGGWARLYLYAVEAGRQVVVAKLILPITALAAIAAISAGGDLSLLNNSPMISDALN